MDVGGSKTQHPKSSVQEQILAAIVLDQPVAMVPSVVFDHKPRVWVVQVSPADESTVAVTKICLYLRAREAGLEQ